LAEHSLKSIPRIKADMKRAKSLKLTTILFLCAFLFCANFLHAQNLTVRNGHSMVYDTADKHTLLFGGADEKKVYGDLWALGRKRWELVNNDGPEPRTFAGFVYDEDNKRALLFGGNSVLFGSKTNKAKMFNDTWEFKNGNWRKLSPEDSPGPRAAAGISYDQEQKRVILFGGYRMVGAEVVRLGDTWEFKAGNWTKLSDKGPSPRVGSAIAYDSDLQRPVLFGGSTINGNYGARTGETWVLVGDSWKKLKIKQPFNIFDANLVYQKDEKRLFRFGGWNGNGRTDQSWTFKKIWRKFSSDTRPAARNHSSMVYDSASSRIVLFGGYDGEKIFGDLWIFENGKWYKEFEHPPVKRKITDTSSNRYF